MRLRHLFLFLALFLLAAIMLLVGWRQSPVYYAWQGQPAQMQSAAACAQPPLIVDPQFGWRLRFDPDNIGLIDEWQSTTYDSSDWYYVAPGAPWEERGFPDYDGVGWYRASFDISQIDGPLFLSTTGVDDRGTLWLNGIETPIQTVQAVPRTAPILDVAFRIEDEVGFGGIKGPVRLASSESAALNGGDYIRWLKDRAPLGSLPGWAGGKLHAWTFSGGWLAADEALLTADAAVAPWADAPIIELWVRLADGTVVAAENAQFSLPEGQLPLPKVSWQAGSATINAQLASSFNGDGVYWAIDVSNSAESAQPIDLYFVVRPLSAARDVLPIHTLGTNKRGQLWLNDQPYLTPSTPPDTTTFSRFEDVLPLIASGDLNALETYCEPTGYAAAMLHYAVDSGASEQLTFAFPSSPSAESPSARDGLRQIESVSAEWQAALGDPVLSVPDEWVMEAFRASRNYLQIALDEDGPHPGPLAHDAVWVRDAAFIGETLLALGETQAVADFLPTLTKFQRDDGYVPAIIAADGPLPDEEWDAQGQLIFLIAELNRYGEDVSGYYENVKLSAEFLRTLRARTVDDPPTSRGILPPSKSAEDLGPPHYHHYWDDFWGIVGLLDGAELARQYGYAGDAVWMEAEAAALKVALLASIEATMGADAAYIPNGPEDITSSAMARGSANSLYPRFIFDRDDPLIVRSFNEYHQRWIEPSGGGYTHIFNQWWPYGGMGLARDYIRLGRQDILHQILGWTLTHQTLPGTFAWAEQVNPGNGSFSGGDMPHAWAAATYLMLIREMVVLHADDQLEILGGVPGSWLTAGKQVSLYDAPTVYGAIQLNTESALQIEGDVWVGQLELTVEGANPPGGYIWRLPVGPVIDVVSGSAEIVDGWLIIPPKGGTVTLQFGE